MKRAWAYILKCADDSYYVGSTTNIQKRIAEHTSGLFDGYTAARKPITPLWSQEFDDIRFAIEAERQIKKWTRARKEALMRADFKELNLLSRSSATKAKNRIA